MMKNLTEPFSRIPIKYILVVLCKGVFSVVSHSPFKIVCPGVTDLFHKYFCQIYPENQRTNGPLNAHLLSGPRKSTKHTKPRKKQGQEMTLTFSTHLTSFTELVVCIYKFSGHWLQ